MSKPIESLDDLFADAMQAQRKVMKNAKPEAVKKILVSEKYTLPEFWVKGRTIALIHEETKTLLGNFQEFSHKTERAARKLVRIEELHEAPKVLEYVSGPAWLGTRREALFAPKTDTIKRELLLADLVLHSFDVHAETVGVVVFLRWGGIARVELQEHTTFHSPDARVALTLPAETNILEVMDTEAKVSLRKELSV